MDRRAAILALAAATAGCRAQKTARQLTPEELGRLLEDRDKVFFLDVREPAEIAQLGSIPGYVNIPVGQLQNRLREIPRDKVIVTA
jgi:rhodanese-related sulfurtransferase